LRVFADDPREGVLRDPLVDPRPGLAVVLRLVEVGPEVVELVHRRGDVAGALVARRGVERVDADPFGDPFGRHVGPVLPAVARDLDVAVVGPDPDHVLLRRRLHDGEDRVVDLHTGVIVGDRPSGLALLRLVVARQVRGDLLPRLALVAAPQEDLGAVVEGAGIVRGKQDRRVPLEAVLQVLPPAPDRQLRPPPPPAARAHPRPALVCWRARAGGEGRAPPAVGTGEDDVGVLRLGSDPAALAAADRVPVIDVDAAAAPARGDGDGGVVLLRA